MRSWLPLLPALLVTTVLFGGGLALSVLQSLGYAPALGSPVLSFAAYRELFADRAFWQGLALSAWVAGVSTLGAVVLGTGFALALRSVRAGSAQRFLFGVTLPIPHAVASVLTLLFLSQSGMLSRVTHALGWTPGPQAFPALLYGPSGLGVILELLWKETPFIGLNVLAALTQLDPRFQEVARTLGAGAGTCFRQVTLPLIRPALLSSGILVFAYALSSYEVPALLGATSPTTLPVLAYRAFTDTDLTRRSSAMAISTLLALLGGGLVWAYVRAQPGFRRKG